MEDEPRSEFIGFAPAGTRPNELTLEFRTGNRQQVVTIPRTDAERLVEEIGSFLRMTHSWLATTKL